MAAQILEIDGQERRREHVDRDAQHDVPARAEQHQQPAGQDHDEKPPEQWARPAHQVARGGKPERPHARDRQGGATSGLVQNGLVIGRVVADDRSQADPQQQRQRVQPADRQRARAQRSHERLGQQHHDRANLEQQPGVVGQVAPDVSAECKKPERHRDQEHDLSEQQRHRARTRAGVGCEYAEFAAG